MFVDDPSTRDLTSAWDVPSEWDELIKSGATIYEGTWEGITEYISPTSNPSFNNRRWSAAVFSDRARVSR